LKNRALLFVVCFVSLGTVSVQAQSTSPEIAFVQSHITPGYSLTETGFGSANRITKPGAVYVIRVDGILARAISDSITPTNTVKDGTLLPPARGFRGAFGSAGDTQQVKPGQRFYLHEIKVDADAVTFTFLSLDTISTVVNGRSGQSRLRFYLKFALPKTTVPDLTPESMHKYTDPIFIPESEAAATATVTVQLGQTLEEVKKIMGEPQKVMDLGAKQILIYKDVKVTLVDGKVTDAQ
jgi:hypothetical protein